MDNLRPARREDAFFLGPRLRQADVDECRALYGYHPTLLILTSIINADVATTIVNDAGEPMGVFGVTRHAERVGLVWMVTTDEILQSKYKRRWLRGTMEGLKLLHSIYPCLTNMVSKANTVHLRWLQFMGFKKVGERQVNGHPFIEFARIQSTCA